VTRYEANDGSLFESETEATAHDAYLEEVKVVEAMLPARPDDGSQFENGAGYLQHTPEKVREFKRAVLMLAAKDDPDSEFIEWAREPDRIRGMGIVGRSIDDGCDRYVGRLWHRVRCMDDRCREWGQPYFAPNPGEGEAFAIAA
jgi:hypothetical protein